MFFDCFSEVGTANLGALALLLIAALWLRYISTRDRFAAGEKNGGDAKGAIPPMFPYMFPLLGSLPVTYLWKPRDFVLNPNHFFQSAHPVRVKILTHEFYVLRGPENVKALFRSSWACTSIPFVKFALGYAFGLPAKALSLYDKDDSGGGHVPHAGSTVEARNRIDYRVHESLARFLEGKGQRPFWNRFAGNITQQLYGLYNRIGSDWEYHADLMKMVGDETAVSILDALCGPYLLGLNPHFLQDYWEFDRNLQTYLQGVPWFLAPRAYAARKRVLDAVKVWQQHARDHYHDSSRGDDGDDPFWGSSFFRERQAMFLEMDGFDYAAIASEDFGAIWAVRNSISATSWAVFEIYRDPELLASIRAEVDACVLTSVDGRIRFDIDQLLRLPVLQAVYAETLRLRMDFYIIRMPDRVDMNIQDWVIPRRKVIVTPTTVAHMDSKAWNTGSKNEHPVDRFWVGRFLKYPSKSPAASPEFSTRELEGSWIPYGGGPRQCPGRHFAKRQILLTTALMVSLFDCEISKEGKNVQGDSTLKGFGGGMAHPAGKVPVRIRHRDRGSMYIP
ncbi:cytochrome P450 [Biscogniauxia sp. FL1348]|nr:cytochrome P450 [Biscogniauxia sp. FL1348]